MPIWARASARGGWPTTLPCLQVVTSANVACGFHAGDPQTMRRVCTLAAERGVRIGAHVSYRDLAGFGRRYLAVDPVELRTRSRIQIAGLDGMARAAGTRVSYVKAHGALYNRAADDPSHAGALLSEDAGLRPRAPAAGTCRIQSSSPSPPTPAARPSRRAIRTGATPPRAGSRPVPRPAACSPTLPRSSCACRTACLDRTGLALPARRQSRRPRTGPPHPRSAAGGRGRARALLVTVTGVRRAGERAVVLDVSEEPSAVAAAIRALAARLNVTLTEVVPGAVTVLICGARLRRPFAVDSRLSAPRDRSRADHDRIIHRAAGSL